MSKIILLCLFLVSLFAYANDIEKDSLQINTLFSKALQNPTKGDSLNHVAKKLVVSSDQNLILNDTYHYQLAIFLFRTSQLDSAVTVSKMGLKLHQPSQKPAYKSFKFHNILGSVYVYKNMHKKAVQEFQIAIKILESHGNYHQAALIKNNLANVFFSLHDYESSYKYSKQAYEQLKMEKDSVYLPSLTGVYAVSAIKLNYLEQSDSLANESLELSQKYNNVLGLIVSNYCLGDVNLGIDNYQKAETFFKTSLQISESVGNQHFIMLNKVGLLYANVNLKQFDLAVKYGIQALEESKAQKNDNTLYAIHKNLGYAYFGINDFKKAYININKAHEMYQKSATLENKKAINDILVKYDTEKKEKEIAKNKLEIAQNDIQLNKRKQWIIGLAAVVILLLVTYFFYSRIQKQKMIQAEKDEEQKRILALITGEEKERERISNELHDGVASSITGIKIQLELINQAQPNSQIEKLVNQLSSLHEETRKISHNLMPISLNDNSLESILEKFCNENSHSKLDIKFQNLTKEKLPINNTKAIVVYRMVQELINNVKKHSKATICHVQVSDSDKELSIFIEDNGVGFDPKTKNNSQGLSSIKKRIKQLNGEIEINSTTNNGTVILLIIPFDL